MNDVRGGVGLFLFAYREVIAPTHPSLTQWQYRLLYSWFTQSGHLLLHPHMAGREQERSLSLSLFLFYGLSSVMLGSHL